jgi:hypothetical protein
MKFISMALAIALLGGCATVKVPLCPAIAWRSYPDGSTSSNVNYFVQVQAKERNVEVNQISAFTARLSGSSTDIKWFDENYREMLCSFDHRLGPQVPLPDDIYLGCMTHADTWKEIVRSASPERLATDNSQFMSYCAPPSGSKR